MAENYDPLPDLALLFDAALRAGWSALPYVDRLVERLELKPSAGPEAAEALLRKTLGLKTCLCGISPGAPSEVIPLACPVHGTPCEECGGLEACRPAHAGGFAPVDSGTDSDGTPWAVAASIPGLIVSVGTEDVFLKGEQRDRFAEAVARAVTPGQVAP